MTDTNPPSNDYTPDLISPTIAPQPEPPLCFDGHLERTTDYQVIRCVPDALPATGPIYDPTVTVIIALAAAAAGIHLRILSARRTRRRQLQPARRWEQ